MVKPPSSVRSIRLPDATWEALVLRAAGEGLSVNAYVAGLVDAALSPAKPPAELKPAGKKIAGYTTSGEPIEAPAFVSRLKEPKGSKK